MKKHDVLVERELVSVRNGACFGIKVNLGEVPLLLVAGEKGYLVCGFFDPKTIEKVKDAGAIVRGVKTFQELLDAKVDFASKEAVKLGVRKGMRGEKALEKLV